MTPEQRRKELKNKYYQLIPLIMTGYGIIGVFVFVFKDKLFETGNLTILLFGTMAVVGLFMSMFNYLQKNKIVGDTNRSSVNNNIDASEILKSIEFQNYQIEEKLEKRFINLQELIASKLKSEPTISFTNDQKEEVYKTVLTSISSNLTKDFFDTLKENVKAQILVDKREQIFSLLKRGEQSTDRLRREVDLLSRRANINLIIGSIITISALFLLGYFVVRENFNSDKIIEVSLHFIPRLSLVIFIELFSFFFLKLYRASLGEIKYYQNELTNLELKQTALFTATNFGTDKDLSQVINDFSNTERNFKLQKGESTVELEKIKVETHNLKEILKASIGTLSKNKD